MNPDLFLARTDRDTLSTLAHEMCHVWQYGHGEPGRGRYHNAAWADRMEAVGLMPSDTGAPGGKRTGQRVTHYVIDGGPFDRAAAELLATGWAVKRGSTAIRQKRGPDRSKVEFTCGRCGQNAWAKTGARLVCGACDQPMNAAVAAA
jgi:predicted SprT family Zn-dependent metalloprotease